MKDFMLLTKEDVEMLRRKFMSVPSGKHIIYNFTSTQIYDAKKHLETLYPDSKYVTKSFAINILILNLLEALMKLKN